MSPLQPFSLLIAFATLSFAAVPLCGAESSLPTPKPNEAKILAALDQQTELAFVDQPLSDVVEYLKENHKIEIQLDNKALADEGFSSDTPITRNLKGVSLESALDLLLGELDMAYVVRGEVMLVTSQKVAESMLSAKVYPVADMVAAANGSAGAGQGDDYQTLIEMITTSVDPTTWEGEGGPGSIQEFRNSQALVISQTFAVHRQIERLLAAARDVRRAQAIDEPEQAEEEVKDDETLYARVYRLPAAWPRPSGMGMGGGMGGMIAPAPAKVAAPAEEKAGDKLAPKRVRSQLGMGGAGMGGAGAAAPPRAYPTAGELVEAIPAVIAPESWDVSGGLGAIRPAGNALIVRQTRPVHREIVRLLEQLK